MSFASGVGEPPWKDRRSYRIELVRSTRDKVICPGKRRYVYGVDAFWFHRTHQINR
jgi:hypothetical protein